MVKMLYCYTSNFIISLININVVELVKKINKIDFLSSHLSVVQKSSIRTPETWKNKKPNFIFSGKTLPIFRNRVQTTINPQFNLLGSSTADRFPSDKRTDSVPLLLQNPFSSSVRRCGGGEISTTMKQHNHLLRFLLLPCLLLLLFFCCCSDARFVVEKNSLSVTSPESIKGTHDSAIGNFGIPQYGGSMAGTVIYPKENQKSCKEFSDFSISFKSQPGALPTFLLVDRGGKQNCFLRLVFLFLLGIN